MQTKHDPCRLQDVNSGVNRDVAAASSPAFTQAAASSLHFQQLHYTDHISLLLLSNNTQAKRADGSQGK